MNKRQESKQKTRELILKSAKEESIEVIFDSSDLNGPFNRLFALPRRSPLKFLTEAIEDMISSVETSVLESETAKFLINRLFSFLY